MIIIIIISRVWTCVWLVCVLVECDAAGVANAGCRCPSLSTMFITMFSTISTGNAGVANAGCRILERDAAGVAAQGKITNVVLYNMIMYGIILWCIMCICIA